MAERPKWTEEQLEKVADDVWESMVRRGRKWRMTRIELGNIVKEFADEFDSLDEYKDFLDRTLDPSLDYYENRGLVDRAIVTKYPEKLAGELASTEELMVISALNLLKERPELYEKYRDMLNRLASSTKELADRLDELASRLNEAVRERDRYKREIERLRGELNELKKKFEERAKEVWPAVRVTADMERRLKEEIISEAIYRGGSPLSVRRWVEGAWPRILEELRAVEEEVAVKRLPPEEAEEELRARLAKLRDELVERALAATGRVTPAILRAEVLAPGPPPETHPEFRRFLAEGVGITVDQYYALPSWGKIQVLRAFRSWLERRGA